MLLMLVQAQSLWFNLMTHQVAYIRGVAYDGLLEACYVNSAKSHRWMPGVKLNPPTQNRAFTETGERCMIGDVGCVEELFGTNVSCDIMSNMPFGLTTFHHLVLKESTILEDILVSGLHDPVTCKVRCLDHLNM